MAGGIVVFVIVLWKAVGGSIRLTPGVPTVGSTWPKVNGLTGGEGVSPVVDESVTPGGPLLVTREWQFSFGLTWFVDG